MRDINFSSSSSENLTRSPAFRRRLHDQSQFLPSNSLINSNNTVQDYRFLPKPATRVEDNNFYSNLNQSSYNSNWRQTISELLKSPINGLSKNSQDLRNSFVEKTTEKNVKYVKTPYPQAYKPDSYLRNDIYLPSRGNNLPLLPPSRFSFKSETRHTINRSSNSANKYNLGSNDYDLQRDTQTCRKRNLQQVYRQKDEHEYDEEEFHDAISDDNNINGESINNPNKKPIIPPQKKTYNQTPSTAAQTGLLGTQNNTPNKPTNTYGLPLSMIDDDYKPDPAPIYNFSDEKLRDAQKQTNILGLTEYSHPYNFPKVSFLPPNTEPSSNNAPSSVQRIRTPLRYRSSLLGALSNRTNSSCRILSAAEMKKVFCKSKKPIGSLKDFVHTIELRNEVLNETKTNLELSKTIESHSEIKNTIEDKSTNNVKCSSPKEDSNDNKEDIASSKSESSNQSNTEVSNILSNANKSISTKKTDQDKEAIEKTSNVDDLPTSSNKFGNYDSKLPVQSEQGNITFITANTSEITMEKKDDSQETKGADSEDLSLKDKDSEVSETKKDEPVPWWLANVNKPNLVEVDNEGVFMPDEDDEPKDNEEKSTVSAAGLFSLPSNEGSSDKNTTTSLFSFGNTSTITSALTSTGNSLFGPSLFQNNKADENNASSEEPKPEEKAPPLPIGQSSNFSFNQSIDNNTSNSVSLFGITSKTVEETNKNCELEKPISKAVVDMEKETTDSNLKPQLSIFGKQSLDEEKKQTENPEKKIGIFATDNSGSIFSSTNNNTSNLFSQQSSSINQLFGSSSISNSTQNAFDSKDIFNLSSSGISTINNSEKKEVPAPIFGSSVIESKNSASEISFSGSSGLGNLNSSSDMSFADSNTTPQTNLQTTGLFDTKLINFTGSTNSSTTASSSLFGGSNPSNSTLGLGNSLFTVPNNNTTISGLFQNPNTANSTNVSSTTDVSSIFGVQQVPVSNANQAQNNLNFDYSIGGSSNSVAGSTNNINIFSQTPSIFGSSNSSNPFFFGSNNKPNDQTVTQTPGQNLEQSNNSNIFGSPQGIFNSNNKTETSIFGGMPNNPVATQFDPKPQVPGQPPMNTSIFGSNPSNLLGVSPLVGNNSNPNPFVGHSSNPAGGTSHRRRIARAKRSH